MYDIKTHDTEAIKANIEDYERQLNVYAHIWQNLRGQRLDETAVICTQLPEGLKQAVGTGVQQRIEYELARWEPVIPCPFEPEHVTETIAAFGEVVDEIEDHGVRTVRSRDLNQRLPGTTRTFRLGNMPPLRNALLLLVVPRVRSRGQQRRRGAYHEYFDDYGDDDVQGERIVAGLRYGDAQAGMKAPK